MADAVRVTETLAIYGRLIAAQARAQASYRISFVLDLAGNLLLLSADLLTVLVVFRQVPSLAGFSLAECMVVFALAGAAFSLADLLVGNIERLKLYVRTGLMDAVLIRPLHSLTQLLALDVGFRRLGRVAFSVVLIAATTHAAGVDWTPARVLLVLLTPLCGAVFFSSIFIATATISFWWVESGELSASLTYGGRDFTSYPMTIYGGWLRRVFAFGLGFAFVSYYPSLMVLGRTDPLGGPAWLSWLGPAVAGLAAGVAALVWRTGIRHYRSTGS